MQEKEGNTQHTLLEVFDKIVDAMSYLGCFLILFQAVSVTADVIGRAFFNRPIPGTLAINEWTMVYITFFGFAWLQRKGGHVRMDIFIDLFKEKKRVLFDIIGHIFGIFISIILTIFGVKVFWMQVVIGTMDHFKLPGFPIAIITISIPIGCLLLFVQLLRDTYNDIKKYKTLSKKEEAI